MIHVKCGFCCGPKDQLEEIDLIPFCVEGESPVDVLERLVRHQAWILAMAITEKDGDADELWKKHGEILRELKTREIAPPEM